MEAIQQEWCIIPWGRKVEEKLDTRFLALQFIWHCHMAYHKQNGLSFISEDMDEWIQDPPWKKLQLYTVMCLSDAV